VRSVTVQAVQLHMHAHALPYVAYVMKAMRLHASDTNTTTHSTTPAATCVLLCLHVVDLHIRMHPAAASSSPRPQRTKRTTPRARPTAAAAAATAARWMCARAVQWLGATCTQLVVVCAPAATSQVRPLRVSPPPSELRPFRIVPE